MTIRVLLAGQSNALGRGSGGPAFSGVSSDVSVWNNINPLGANGSAFVTAAAALAAGVFENTDRNNLGVWFCDRLARSYFDDVTLTCVARGASPIAYWSPSEVTYPMLQETIDVWTATGQGPANVFIWMQGEGDSSSSDYAGYISSFSTLVSDLKNAGVLDDSTNIVVLGICPSTDTKIAFNDKALYGSAVANNGVYIPTTALANDGTHYTGQALYSLGSIYSYTGYSYNNIRQG